jgi:hypothetical protein
MVDEVMTGTWVQDPVTKEVSLVNTATAVDLYAKGFTAPSLNELTKAGRLDNTGNLVPFPDATARALPITNTDNEDITIGQLKPHTTIQQPPMIDDGRFGNFNVTLFNPKSNQTVKIQDRAYADALIKTGYWRAPDIEYVGNGIQLKNPNGTIPFAISNPPISLPPGVKPGTKLVLPKGYDKVIIKEGTKDKSNVIQLNAKEFVDAIDYYKLSKDEQELLKKVGTKQFNDDSKAKSDKTNADVAQLEAEQGANAAINEHETQAYYDTLSEEDKHKLNIMGKDRFNALLDYRKAIADKVLIVNGEQVGKEHYIKIKDDNEDGYTYVSKPYFDRLSQDEQDKLQLLGRTKYNDLLDLRAQSNAKSLIVNGEPVDKIHYQELKAGGYVPVAYYNTLSEEDKTNINSLGADKFNDLKKLQYDNELKQIEDAKIILQPYALYEKMRQQTDYGTGTKRGATYSVGHIANPPKGAIPVGYDYAKALRDNDKDPTDAVNALRTMGVKQETIDALLKQNKDYYNVKELDYSDKPQFDNYRVRYFRSKGWEDYELPEAGNYSGSNVPKDFLLHVNEARAAYDEQYSPKLTRDDYARTYFDDNGEDFDMSMAKGASSAQLEKYNKLLNEATDQYIKKYGVSNYMQASVAKAVSNNIMPIFTPGRALDPAVKITDISKAEWAQGIAEIALLTAPLWIPKVISGIKSLVIIPEGQTGLASKLSYGPGAATANSALLERASITQSRNPVRVVDWDSLLSGVQRGLEPGGANGMGVRGTTGKANIPTPRRTGTGAGLIQGESGVLGTSKYVVLSEAEQAKQMYDAAKAMADIRKASYAKGTAQAAKLAQSTSSKPVISYAQQKAIDKALELTKASSIVKQPISAAQQRLAEQTAVFAKSKELSAMANTRKASYAKGAITNPKAVTGNLWAVTMDDKLIPVSSSPIVIPNVPVIIPLSSKYDANVDRSRMTPEQAGKLAGTSTRQTTWAVGQEMPTELTSQSVKDWAQVTANNMPKPITGSHVDTIRQVAIQNALDIAAQIKASARVHNISAMQTASLTNAAIQSSIQQTTKDAVSDKRLSKVDVDALSKTAVLASAQQQPYQQPQPKPKPEPQPQPYGRTETATDTLVDTNAKTNPDKDVRVHTGDITDNLPAVKDITKPQPAPKTTPPNKEIKGVTPNDEKYQPKPGPPEKGERKSPEDEKPKPPTKKLGKNSDNKQSQPTRKELKDAVAWPQGFGWYVIYKHNGQLHKRFYIGQHAPEGVKDVQPGIKEAYRGIQSKLGKTDKVGISMGVFNVTVKRPEVTPGKAGAITYNRVSLPHGHNDRITPKRRSIR